MKNYEIEKNNKSRVVRANLKKGVLFHSGNRPIYSKSKLIEAGLKNEVVRAAKYKKDGKKYIEFGVSEKNGYSIKETDKKVSSDGMSMFVDFNYVSVE